MTVDLEALALALDEAATSAAPIAQLTATTTLSLDDAYAVQHLLVARRVARGDALSGIKLGFTSPAKAAQMGVSDVIIGELMFGMRIADGGQLDRTEHVHPRVEPEVAFRFGTDVDPDDDALDLEAAIDAVAPALEVIDSRYRDFSFTLADVVADNASAARYVLGPWRDPVSAGDLDNRGVVLEVDGRIVETGSTAAILGHPRRAVHAARRLARAHGMGIPAGTVLLAGAATAAAALTPGSFVEATITGLGRVGFHVQEAADG